MYNIGIFYNYNKGEIMEKIYAYFLGFIIYSFLGWIMETALCSFLEKKIVNRGFLIGPICPIYGSGAILISMFLSNYKNDWVVVFCLATILAGILVGQWKKYFMQDGGIIVRINLI